MGTWTTLLRRSCSASQCTGDAEAFSAASMWRQQGRRTSQSASVEAPASRRTCCPSTTRQFATHASTMHRASEPPSRRQRRLFSNLGLSTLEVQYLQQRLGPVLQALRAPPLCCRDSLWPPLPTSAPMLPYVPCSGLYRYACSCFRRKCSRC